MEVYFKPSDIVWAKLGPFWWPGEVVDKTQVPEEVTESLKRDPLAIVKFFDEEYYECVKTPDCIYHYNCDRKNDFIKKGMDAFRANNPKMASFPKDVTAAEVKTGGNANILSDAMFVPGRKRNYEPEIFGSPSPKKSKNNTKGRPKQAAPIITHRRFLGFDDFEARVLIQSPAEDADLDNEAQPSPIPEEDAPSKFTCPICHFVTDRLGILRMHISCHPKGVDHISKPILKKPQKRKRKKALSDEEFTGNDNKTKTKRKYKKKTTMDESSLADDEKSGADTSFSENRTGKSNKTNDVHSSEPLSEGKKDVCIDIIADWDDESNQDSTEEIDVSVTGSTLGETQKTGDIALTEASSTNDSALESSFEPTEDNKSNSAITNQETTKTRNPDLLEEAKLTEDKKEKDPNTSCFDFDEDEEDNRIPNAVSGRKIPRVIPISDKRKSFNFEDDLANDEEEMKKKKILEESEQLTKSLELEEKDQETQELERTYQSLMDETSKIELPEIPNILKSEQNFRCAKTVKYPDKPDEVPGLEAIDVEVVEIKSGETSDTKVDFSEDLEVQNGTKSNENEVSGKTEKSRTKIKHLDESELDRLLAKYSAESETCAGEQDDWQPPQEVSINEADSDSVEPGIVEDFTSHHNVNETKHFNQIEIIESEILIENEITFEEDIQSGIILEADNITLVSKEVEIVTDEPEEPQDVVSSKEDLPSSQDLVSEIIEENIVTELETQEKMAVEVDKSKKFEAKNSSRRSSKRCTAASNETCSRVAPSETPIEDEESPTLQSTPQNIEHPKEKPPIAQRSLRRDCSKDVENKKVHVPVSVPIVESSPIIAADDEEPEQPKSKRNKKHNKNEHKKKKEPLTDELSIADKHEEIFHVSSRRSLRHTASKDDAKTKPTATDESKEKPEGDDVPQTTPDASCEPSISDKHEENFQVSSRRSLRWDRKSASKDDAKTKSKAIDESEEKPEDDDGPHTTTDASSEPSVTDKHEENVHFSSRRSLRGDRNTTSKDDTKTKPKATDESKVKREGGDGPQTTTDASSEPSVTDIHEENVHVSSRRSLRWDRNTSSKDDAKTKLKATEESEEKPEDNDGLQTTTDASSEPSVADKLEENVHVSSRRSLRGDRNTASKDDATTKPKAIEESKEKPEGNDGHPITTDASSGPSVTDKHEENVQVSSRRSLRGDRKTASKDDAKTKPKATDESKEKPEGNDGPHTTTDTSSKNDQGAADPKKIDNSLLTDVMEREGENQDVSQESEETTGPEHKENYSSSRRSTRSDKRSGRRDLTKPCASKTSDSSRNDTPIAPDPNEQPTLPHRRNDRRSIRSDHSKQSAITENELLQNEELIVTDLKDSFQKNPDILDEQSESPQNEKSKTSGLIEESIPSRSSRRGRSDRADHNTHSSKQVDSVENEVALIVDEKEELKQIDVIKQDVLKEDSLEQKVTAAEPTSHSRRSRRERRSSRNDNKTQNSSNRIDEVESELASIVDQKEELEDHTKQDSSKKDEIFDVFDQFEEPVSTPRSSRRDRRSDRNEHKARSSVKQSDSVENKVAIIVDQKEELSAASEQINNLEEQDGSKKNDSIRNEVPAVAEVDEETTSVHRRSSRNDHRIKSLSKKIDTKESSIAEHKEKKSVMTEQDDDHKKQDSCKKIDLTQTKVPFASEKPEEPITLSRSSGRGRKSSRNDRKIQDPSSNIENKIDCILDEKETPNVMKQEDTQEKSDALSEADCKEKTTKISPVEEQFSGSTRESDHGKQLFPMKSDSLENKEPVEAVLQNEPSTVIEKRDSPENFDTHQIPIVIDQIEERVPSIRHCEDATSSIQNVDEKKIDPHPTEGPIQNEKMEPQDSFHQSSRSARSCRNDSSKQDPLKKIGSLNSEEPIVTEQKSEDPAYTSRISKRDRNSSRSDQKEMSCKADDTLQTAEPNITEKTHQNLSHRSSRTDKKSRRNDHDIQDSSKRSEGYQKEVADEKKKNISSSHRSSKSDKRSKRDSSEKIDESKNSSSTVDERSGERKESSRRSGDNTEKQNQSLGKYQFEKMAEAHQKDSSHRSSRSDRRPRKEKQDEFKDNLVSESSEKRQTTSAIAAEGSDLSISQKDRKPEDDKPEKPELPKIPINVDQEKEKSRYDNRMMAEDVSHRGSRKEKRHYRGKQDEVKTSTSNRDKELVRTPQKSSSHRSYGRKSRDRSDNLEESKTSLMSQEKEDNFKTVVTGQGKDLVPAHDHEQLEKNSHRISSRSKGEHVETQVASKTDQELPPVTDQLAVESVSHNTYRGSKRYLAQKEKESKTSVISQKKRDEFKSSVQEKDIIPTFDQVVAESASHQQSRRSSRENHTEKHDESQISAVYQETVVKSTSHSSSRRKSRDQERVEIETLEMDTEKKVLPVCDQSLVDSTSHRGYKKKLKEDFTEKHDESSKEIDFPFSAEINIGNTPHRSYTRKLKEDHSQKDVESIASVITQETNIMLDVEEITVESSFHQNSTGSKDDLSDISQGQEEIVPFSRADSESTTCHTSRSSHMNSEKQDHSETSSSPRKESLLHDAESTSQPSVGPERRLSHKEKVQMTSESVCEMEKQIVVGEKPKHKQDETQIQKKSSHVSRKSSRWNRSQSKEKELTSEILPEIIQLSADQSSKMEENILPSLAKPEPVEHTFGSRSPISGLGEGKAAEDVAGKVSIITGLESTEAVDHVEKTDGINISPVIQDKDIAAAVEQDKGKLPNSAVSQPISGRRNRKPSRWDQKERPVTVSDKEQKRSRWDQGDKPKEKEEEIAHEQVATNAVVAKTEISLDETKRKEDETVLQKDESSFVDQTKAEQIEFIFGSSPLPKLNESELFTKESERVQDKSIDNSVRNDDSHELKPDLPLSQGESTLDKTENILEKNEDTGDSRNHLPNLAFSDDLMESVESQVARITHYEEPVLEETQKKSVVSDDVITQPKKESIFDTPEKKEKIPINTIFDALEDKSQVDCPTTEIQLKVEKTGPQLLETDLTKPEMKLDKSIPKSKKNYLLIEKSKLEKIDKSPEIFKDKFGFLQDLPSSSSKIVDKSDKEVATKLTNPKKRFVKSFEDFELNKQKEKSIDATTCNDEKLSKPDTNPIGDISNKLETKSISSVEEKTETKSSSTPGIVGKSPIVFKLKKQFLSKISNIFDEDNEEENRGLKSSVKTKPAVIPKKKITSLLNKAEIGVTSTKSEAVICTTKAEDTASSQNNLTNVIDTSEDPTQAENLKISLDRSISQDRCQSEKPGDTFGQGETSELEELDRKRLIEMDNATVSKSAHEVHFVVDDNSPVEFDIKTNLTNIGKTEALCDLSALINIPILQSEDLRRAEEESHVDDSKTKIITKNFPLESKKEEPELVPIDGNLTVVSEKELAEGQVEITASMPSKKPVTLMNFSMDFSDDSCDASFEVFKKEKLMGITESLDLSKNSEDEFKDPFEFIKNEANFSEKQPSEPIPKNNVELNDEIKTTAQHELDNDNNKTEIKIGENQNIVIEDILGIKEMVKTEPETKDTSFKTSKPQRADNIQSNDPLYFFTESVSSNSSSKLSDQPVPTEKLETSKKSDRKKPKVTVSSSSNEPLVIYNTAKSSTVTDMCDLEDHIPSQIVCAKTALMNEEVIKAQARISNESTVECPLPKVEPPISKILGRSSSEALKEDQSAFKISDVESKKKEVDLKTLKLDPSATKTLIKAAIKSKGIAPQLKLGVPNTKCGNKAIILSEKIIRPARDAVTPTMPLKRSFEDVEDIKPYIISKTPKLETKKEPEKTAILPKFVSSTSNKVNISSTSKQFVAGTMKQITGVAKTSGKAKILNQTIIRPAGEIFQAKVPTSIEDNLDFDINSMPIVLSDELLTAESLENMPIVLGDHIQKTSTTENLKIVIDQKLQHNNAKILNKPIAIPSGVQSSTPRMPQMKKMQSPKIVQTPGQNQKIIRHASPALATSKPTKYLILPENPNKSMQVLKKPNIVRRSMPASVVSSGQTQNLSSESTGHKIMIVTNQQGQQQRLLLTPAHQKMFGMQLPKVGKTVVKGAVTQKVPLNKVQTCISTTLASTSRTLGVSSPKLVKTPVGTNQGISPQLKLAPPKKVHKPNTPGQQIVKPPQQKTILIKNQHGQTVRKIQGTDDALLDKQVAEQLEAIKVSSLKAQQRQQELNLKATINKQVTAAIRKPYSKRPEIKQTLPTQSKLSHPCSSNVLGTLKIPEQKIPPLAPIKSDRKLEEIQKQLPDVKPVENKPLDRPLNQLVIQDNMGNQTTVTEGQILALPSETVDGQPQSYMLVTLDEAGNLTPLNNEALMSLDPSLAGLTGGDLSNMVLQMDTGVAKDGMNQTAQLQAAPPPTPVQEKVKPVDMEKLKPAHELPPKPVEQVQPSVEPATAQVQVTCNINGEPGQQIILTGDPMATQKFLDSLSEGNTDLANILANAEGSSFLIQADGQQILINTEPSDTQMLQANTHIAEQTDHGNPMFSTHPVKNQDILAAALADTDVFQQDQVTNQKKIIHSQLSPGQSLFPMNVGNVLETSLTLNSPIMTPLEVPSTNSKKIPDEEADILTHIPKNVDLPITITDPNISQTVSHQQVLMASDLQANLELSLPISETSMSVTSEMNSPSFVYSLPNLDVAEHPEISQKSFSSSMPLLTEDIEETPVVTIDSKDDTQQVQIGISDKEEDRKESLTETLNSRRPGMITSDRTFMEEGLCTLGGEMCSSLSEPPPEMFDIPISNDNMNFLISTSQNECKTKTNVSTVESVLLTDDNSMVIPVQPQIVADLKDPPHSADSSSSGIDDKTM